MPVFSANRLSESNALFPDQIEIDAVNDIFYKGALIGYQTMVIARNNIASVRVIKGLLFADIVIESTGGGSIVAKGFAKGDATEILKLLA